jgi:Tol biopolymer transport system component
VLLCAGKCNDNLGKSSPGPITTRVSVGPDNREANAASNSPAISADGRYIAFSSFATNLVLPPAFNKVIFFRDRQLDQIFDISSVDFAVNADCDAATMSSDGRFVAFLTKGVLAGNTQGLLPASAPAPQTTTNIYVRDQLGGGTLTRVIDSVAGSPALWPNRDCANPSISADGRFVAFSTQSDNLGYANAGFPDQICVADLSVSPPLIRLVSHATGAATVGTGRSINPRISSDGTSVSFQSLATNLTAVATANEQVFIGGPSPWSSDVRLVSRATGALGAMANNNSFQGAISSTGQFVVFYTQAANLGAGASGAILVLRDTVNFRTTLVARDPIFVTAFINSFSDGLDISADGRYVVYGSTSRQIHVRDMQGGTVVASVNQAGIPQNDGPRFILFEATISGDGRWAVWQSPADNLVPADTNGVEDVFIRGPLF